MEPVLQSAGEIHSILDRRGGTPPETQQPEVRRRRFGTRWRSIAGAFATQTVASLTTFTLLIVAARAIGADQLGYLLLAYSGVVFITGLNQAYNVEPVPVTSPHSDAIMSKKVLQETYARSTLLALAISGPTSVYALLAAPSEAKAVLIAACLLLPMWVVSDTNRTLRQAAGLGWTAALFDMAQYASLTVILVVFASSLKTAAGFLLALGAASSITALAILFSSMVSVRRQPEQPLVHVARATRNHIALEFLSMQGANQLILFTTPLYMPLSSTAGFRGVQLLFGPANIAFTALRLAAAPQLSKSIRDSQRLTSSRRLWCKYAWPVLVAGLLVVVLVTLFSGELGPVLLGDTWDTAKVFVLPISIQYLALSVTNFALVALRATGETRYSLTARAVQASLAVLAAATAWLWTTPAALGWLLAISTSVASLLWIALAAHSLRKYDNRIGI